MVNGGLKKEIIVKIDLITRSFEECKKCDFRSAVVIEINSKEEFKVSDGEPEDSNIGRDFSDVMKIPHLMELAYNAGKNGEEFSVDRSESDGI